MPDFFGLERVLLPDLKKVHSHREIEQKHHVGSFLLRLMLAALGGLVIGGVMNRFVGYFQGDRTTRWYSLVFVLAQLVIDIGLLFAAMKFIPGSTEFLADSFAGFFFGITFFLAQSWLAENIKAVLA